MVSFSKFLADCYSVDVIFCLIIIWFMQLWLRYLRLFPLDLLCGLWYYSKFYWSSLHGNISLVFKPSYQKYWFFLNYSHLAKCTFLIIACVYMFCIHILRCYKLMVNSHAFACSCSFYIRRIRCYGYDINFGFFVNWPVVKYSDLCFLFDLWQCSIEKILFFAI